MTIQAQILKLMLELKERTGAAVILITHDLGVVAETCQRVIVMYAGRKIEEAPILELFDRPAHPYTRGLMASIPRYGGGRARKRRLAEIPGIVPSLREPIEGCAFAPRCPYAVERCRVEAPAAAARSATAHVAACHRRRGRCMADRRSGRHDRRPSSKSQTSRSTSRCSAGFLRRTVAQVKAVDGVSFAIDPGETLCLVGESGCGKSTVGKLVLRLHRADRGLDPAQRRGHHDALGATRCARSGERMQMVFQDPYASLNPRLKAGQIVGEPLENYSDGERIGAGRDDRGAVREGRPARRRDAALPVRVLRRPAPAPRHRARAGAEPRA